MIEIANMVGKESINGLMALQGKGEGEKKRKLTIRTGLEPVFFYILINYEAFAGTAMARYQNKFIILHFYYCIELRMLQFSLSLFL